MFKTHFVSGIPKIFFIGILLILTCQTKVWGQVSINGPVCIIPGMPYQYKITGVWKDPSSVQVCVTGGVLNNGVNCSLSGSILSNMVITWKDTSQHFIELRSTDGKIKFAIQSTYDLTGGKLLETDKVMSFDTSIKEYIFHCGPASGGACTPEYKYQWQKSGNGINWSTITGATEQNLIFREGITVNTYFRRMVEEKISGLIAYSEPGLLAVNF